MKGDYLPPEPPSPGGDGGEEPSRSPWEPLPGHGRLPGDSGPDGPAPPRISPPRVAPPLVELVPPPERRRPAPPPHRPRWLRAAILLALTFVTTTTLGAIWLLWAHPTDSIDAFPWLSPHTLRTVWTDPGHLVLGLSFALPALFILLCHEMGHYLACRHYGLPATLPYFLPAPLGIGTLGAFIRIRAPIRSRKQLFDVGVAGPLAGFVALLPFLVIGVRMSEPVAIRTISPEAAEVAFQAAEIEGERPDVAMLLVPGHNLALELAIRMTHGPLPPDTVLHFHPFALAAWFGLLVTALNLLPLGQLDGGHVLYASAGRLQWRLALPLWTLLLLGAAFVYRGWAVWAVLILLLIGLRHPPVEDEHRPLGAGRQALAVVALLIFVLSLMPVPLEEIFVGIS